MNIRTFWISNFKRSDFWKELPEKKVLGFIIDCHYALFRKRKVSKYHGFFRRLAKILIRVFLNSRTFWISSYRKKTFWDLLLDVTMHYLEKEKISKYQGFFVDSQKLIRVFLNIRTFWILNF